MARKEICMSAAAAAQAPDAAPKKGKKKLIIIIAVVLLVLGLVAGGGLFFVMKQQAAAAAAAAAEEDEDEPRKAQGKAAASKVDPAAPPTFLPLEPFVVNLADRDADRFAQIGVTLHVDDPKFAEQMKAFMPAIRNNVLMILAHKTSEQLLAREGKVLLAEEIAREAVRPMGIEIDPPEAEEADEDPKKKRRKKPAAPHNPVQQVLFSTFIVQ
jgi:flagellar protein FliL